MHLHILGICGTFMGGLAAIAREAGHRVTGCDANVYPPMSDQLRALGIELTEGWDAGQLALKPDVFVVGNVVTRGNPLMEAILDAGAPYTSGPQWLAEQVLRGRHVIAVAGTPIGGSEARIHLYNPQTGEWMRAFDAGPEEATFILIHSEIESHTPGLIKAFDTMAAGLGHANGFTGTVFGPDAAPAAPAFYRVGVQP
jgi:hypothetical protein